MTPSCFCACLCPTCVARGRTFAPARPKTICCKLSGFRRGGPRQDLATRWNRYRIICVGRGALQAGRSTLDPVLIVGWSERLQHGKMGEQGLNIFKHNRFSQTPPTRVPFPTPEEKKESLAFPSHLYCCLSTSTTTYLRAGPTHSKSFRSGTNTYSQTGTATPPPPPPPTPTPPPLSAQKANLPRWFSQLT